MKAHNFCQHRPRRHAHPRLQQLAQALLLLKCSALAGLLESALQRELLVALYELDDAAALLGPAAPAPTS